MKSTQKDRSDNRLSIAENKQERKGNSLPAVPLFQQKQIIQKVAEEDDEAGTIAQLKIEDEEEELPLQKKSLPQPNSAMQRQQHFTPSHTIPTHKFSLQRKENKTGLPDGLKNGVENLSGIAMDDVEVHYNSSKPAEVNALAYARGTDIHIAPGQEKHLPHEAWHVVQQKQGRVQPTLQMKEGIAVNDDKGLETEADVMGFKAFTGAKDLTDDDSTHVVQQRSAVTRNVREGVLPHFKMANPTMQLTTENVIQAKKIRVSSQSKVTLRKEANLDADEIKGIELDEGDIVQFLGTNKTKEWTAVQLPDGTKGWVLSNLLVEQPDPGEREEMSYAKVNAPLWQDSGPKMEDVKQGSLSNCYLMASMAAVASTAKGRQIIKQAIQHNGGGKYIVQLNDINKDDEIEQGEPIAMDNWLPAVAQKSGAPKLIFALKNVRINEVGALWPAILEKAWAVDTNHKTYKEIEDENAAVALTQLTGIKSESLQWNPQIKNFLEQEAFTWLDAYVEDKDDVETNVTGDVLVQELFNAYQLGDQALLAETLEGDDENLLDEEFHIVAGHVYVISEVNLEQKSITLWNPTHRHPPKPLPIAVFHKYFDRVVKGDLRPDKNEGKNEEETIQTKSDPIAASNEVIQRWIIYDSKSIGAETYSGGNYDDGMEETIDEFMSKLKKLKPELSSQAEDNVKDFLDTYKGEAEDFVYNTIEEAANWLIENGVDLEESGKDEKEDNSEKSAEEQNEDGQTVGKMFFPGDTYHITVKKKIIKDIGVRKLSLLVYKDTNHHNFNFWFDRDGTIYADVNSEKNSKGKDTGYKWDGKSAVKS